MIRRAPKRARDFFVRRGEGPCAHRVGVPDLAFEGVTLFDLVQFGADGRAGYQLVDTSPRSTGYYYLFDVQVTHTAPTFSAWLKMALSDEVVE